MAYKFFGAALDALDDPQKVGLKHAYINTFASSKRSNIPLPYDPYDVIVPLLKKTSGNNIILQGKLDLPGWLTPRPSLEDITLVRAENYKKFIDNGDIQSYTDACSDFIKKNIFPDTPCMIGVDHAMAAGPLMAISKAVGPSNLAVIVIDSHFDAIPSHLRALPGSFAPKCNLRNCGSFLSALMKEGILIPENVYVIGVCDYPREDAPKMYASEYESFIKKGVTVIPNDGNNTIIPGKLFTALGKNNATYLYVSLDVDVGSFNSMNAVRFMDYKGLDEKTIIKLSETIREIIIKNNLVLAGMDISEIDIHLVGLQDKNGNPDRTEIICADFIETLLP